MTNNLATRAEFHGNYILVITCYAVLSLFMRGSHVKSNDTHISPTHHIHLVAHCEGYFTVVINFVDRIIITTDAGFYLDFVKF